MAFEKLRTIVITATPKPRSRERFRKIALVTPRVRNAVATRKNSSAIAETIIPICPEEKNEAYSHTLRA